MNTAARWLAAACLLALASCTCTPSYTTGPQVSVALAGDGVGFVTSTPSGLNCPGRCTLQVPLLTEVTLEASPAVAGTTFVGWSGACAGLGLCQLALSADVSVIAAFALRNSLVVTRIGRGRGTVRSEPAGIECGDTCSNIFPRDTEVTLTATAEPGSTFEGWSGACAGLETCVVSAAQAQLVTAAFNAIEVPLTVEVLGPGSGTVVSTPAGISCPGSCAARFNAGTQVTLRANAAVGSSFKTWGGACTSPGVCVMTLSGATSVTATFEVNAIPRLTITPTMKDLGHGEAFTFTASGGVTPYAFSLLTAAGNIDRATGRYTAPSFDAVTTIRVTDVIGTTADAVVRVTGGAALAIAPATKVVFPGDAFRFTVTGGQPPYVFSVPSGGGNVDGTGLYTAPSVAGAAVVRVSDRLGGIADAQVTIRGVLFSATTTTTVNAPQKVLTGDWNADGRNDVAVLNNGTVSFFLGPDLGGADAGASGPFTWVADSAVGSGATSMTVGDWNADGKLDLAVTVANLPADEVKILLGVGDGTFAAPTSVAAGGDPRAASTADFNRDGQADLVVANVTPAGFTVLLGQGDGTFQAPRSTTTGSSCWAVATGDWNRDGKEDLALALSTQVVRVLPGMGDGTFGTGVDYAVVSGSLTLRSGDLNADGKADLVTASMLSGDVNTLLGVGDGTFRPASSLATGSAVTDLTLGDWDRDGKVDLAVTQGMRATVTLLSGVGDGTFLLAPPLAVGAWPASLATIDWNRDGSLDLLVASRDSDALTVLVNGSVRATAFFTSRSGPSGVGAAAPMAGDWNRDGKPDLAFTTLTDTSFAWGQGGGVFTAAQTHLGTRGAMATGDWNRDGKPDVAFASAQVSVFNGGGDGSFAPGSTAQAGTTPSALVTADWNHDGKPDLATANLLSNDVSVLLGVGDGTFLAAISTDAGTNPIALATGDLNRDGQADLVTANQNGGDVSVLLGNGDGTFRPAVHYAVGTTPVSVTTGDVNHDGTLDLAVANQGSDSVSVLLGVGDGTFRPSVAWQVGPMPTMVISGDWNSDGWDDLAVPVPTGNNVTLALTAPRLALPTAAAFSLTPLAASGAGGVTAADWNGDGKLDLAVSRAPLNQVTLFLSGP